MPSNDKQKKAVLLQKQGKLKPIDESLKIFATSIEPYIDSKKPGYNPWVAKILGKLAKELREQRRLYAENLADNQGDEMDVHHKDDFVHNCKQRVQAAQTQLKKLQVEHDNDLGMLLLRLLRDLVSGITAGRSNFFQNLPERSDYDVPLKDLEVRENMVDPAPEAAAPEKIQGEPKEKLDDEEEEYWNKHLQ